MGAYSDAASAYFDGHAIDPRIVAGVGVVERSGELVFTYRPSGGDTFQRVRSLNGAGPAKVRQPKGRPLTPWVPTQRQGTPIVTEGESDALAALSALIRSPEAAGVRELPVIAAPGTGCPPERVVEAVKASEGREAFLAFDADAAGRRYTEKVAAALRAAGIRPVVLELPDGHDLSDWLAGLPEDERGEALASALVDAEAGALEATPPATGAGELLAELVAVLRRFVVMTEAQAAVAALWVLHAHAIDAADTTPYLAVTSAEKRSGKSRLLEVLAELVPNPIEAANISEAALFRALGADGGCTLLFDEIDGTFGPKARDKEDLRALVNAGYRRGARAYRCVGEGARQRVEAFPVFGPKALAGIGELPDTIADRSNPVRLHRRSRTEAIARGRRRTIVAATEQLRGGIERWAKAALEGLRGMEPELPDELDDRAQDGAEPLLAIAEQAGGEWPTRARAALVELHGERTADDDSWGVQLLADIRAVFGDADRLPSAELLDRLRADDEAPWAGWGEKGLQPRGLGKLLGPYGIKSRTIRPASGAPCRGFLRSQFEDAFTRYLPPPGDLAVTSATTALESRKPPSAEALQPPLVTDGETAANPHSDADVADVADSGRNQGPRA